MATCIRATLGYMLLAKALHENEEGFNEPFNFGPKITSNRNVGCS